MLFVSEMIMGQITTKWIKVIGMSDRNLKKKKVMSYIRLQYSAQPPYSYPVTCESCQIRKQPRSTDSQCTYFCVLTAKTMFMAYFVLFL